MKKLILLALTTMIMVGCGRPYKDTKIDSDYSTRVVDSCEYLVVNNVGVKSHKGNCRFCAERRRQELQNIVEQLKGK